MGDGREVEQEVGRPAERRVDRHGVPHGGVGQDVARREPARLELDERARGPPGRVQPDRLARRREGRVRQGEAERLADHLGRRRRPEELAASARRAARAAAHVGRALERDLAVGEAGADGLHRAGVLRVAGGSVTPPGTRTTGQIAHSRERHHHRGEALVARGDAQDTAPRGERPDESAEHLGGVVPVGEAVHHPDRALGPAVAGVGDEAGERQALEPPQLARGRLHQEAHLPVAGVVAEGDRPAVGRADAALGREDEELRAPELAGVPSHARVLGPAEEVAARPVEEHLRRQREAARRPRAHRLDVEKPRRRRAADDLVEPDGRSLALPCAHVSSPGVRP